MLHDPWLDRWLPLMRERAAGRPVLEIGCGHGDDTVTLLAAGLEVHGFDLSTASVAIARLRAPAAQLAVRDVREPLPSASGAFGVVLASLSLHYFPWRETEDIVARIRAALNDDGLLVCRLNAADDVHFGAHGHREIEPGLYDVDGQPKRFFDEAAARRLFASGWNIRAIEHVATTKYLRRKTAWELVVEKA